jgi:hypothetical protein
MITLPEAEAKARLTAAAPDLLAALVEMVFLYEKINQAAGRGRS